MNGADYDLGAEIRSRKAYEPFQQEPQKPEAPQLPPPPHRELEIEASLKAFKL